METESGAEYISPTHVRHILRYVNACQFVKPGMKVVDAACGTGYGTNIIARYTDKVEGWDNNYEAITEARKVYPHIYFYEFDLTKPINGYEVDAVVSIETIEHFAKPDIRLYLNNIRGVLVSRGTFIVTTPYCKESGPSPITKQHLYEFSLTDLEIILNEANFAIEAIYPMRHEGQAGRLGYCMVHAISK